MDCATCQDVISAILDGEASPAEEASAAAHLAVCAVCRAHRAALEEDHAELRAWPREMPDLPDSLGARRTPVAARAAWLLPWAATILLAFAGGVLLGDRRAREVTPVPAPAAEPGLSAGTWPVALALVEWRVYPGTSSTEPVPGASPGRGSEKP